ncbi:MAG: cytochrome c oxidase subunit II, partial [Planctomycetota bacterium]
FFFIPITFCLFYFALKYKKKRGEKAESQVSHNTPVELAWSIGPSFLLVWMFVQGSISFLDMRTPPEGSYEVGVQAFKWGWTFDYGGGTFHPELHIVKGEPTKLEMRSSDVIHSLFVPAFRAKKDIVPGRYNYMWFQPTEANEQVSAEDLAKFKKQNEGNAAWDYDRFQVTPEGYKFFDLYCTEYCGTNHSEMQTAVVVHETQEDLDAWIKVNSQRGDVPMVEWGERLYKQRGCAGCHSIDGSKLVGPSFLNLYGSEHGLTDGSNISVDAQYIRESIINPKAKIVAGYPNVMPSYKGQLSDDDIASIIEYQKSISQFSQSAADEKSDAEVPASDDEASDEPDTPE